MGRPFLERVKGLEPSISAWKANVLPLHYTRVTGRANAPTDMKLQCSVFYAEAITAKQKLVRAKRLELTHPEVLEPKSNASANSATPAK